MAGKKINIVSIENIGEDQAYPDIFSIKFEDGFTQHIGKTKASYYAMSYLNCTGTIRDGIELIDKIDAFKEEQWFRGEVIGISYYIVIKPTFELANKPIGLCHE